MKIAVTLVHDGETTRQAYTGPRAIGAVLAVARIARDLGPFVGVAVSAEDEEGLADLDFDQLDMDSMPDDLKQDAIGFTMKCLLGTLARAVARPGDEQECMLLRGRTSVRFTVGDLNHISEAPATFQLLHAQHPVGWDSLRLPVMCPHGCAHELWAVKTSLPRQHPAITRWLRAAGTADHIFELRTDGKEPIQAEAGGVAVLFDRMGLRIRREE